MNRPLRTALLVLAVAAVFAAAIWGGLWYRARAVTPVAMLQRIPASGAVLVYLDFAALRQGGILGMLERPKIAEDAEYRDFARQIDFNYQKDLDSALLAIGPNGKYLLARGRFDWKRLRAYTESQNGRCYDSLCRMQGSTPERRISFFPVQPDFLALAVSDDDSAALRMSAAAGGPPADVPDAPVWVSIPPAVLESADGLPGETRMFARSLGRAESVTLSFVPEGNRFAAMLAVRCRNTEDASELAAQLARLTTVVREAFDSQHHAPNATDLTGVLTAGAFRSENSRVLGHWPIERAFVDNLLGGEN